MSDTTKEEIKNIITYIYQGLVKDEIDDWKTLKSYIARIKDIEILSDNYIFLCTPDEYGKGVCGYDLSIDQPIISLMINDDDGNTDLGLDNSPWISSFTYLGKGLSEIIYSNRTEYFMNKSFIGYTNDVQPFLEHILSIVNTKIYKEKIFPSLYAIVSEFNQENDIYFIEKKEFDSHESDLKKMTHMSDKYKIKK